MTLIFVTLSVLGGIIAANAREIEFSPTELNFGTVVQGDTAWRDVRFTYSGPDSGGGVVTIYTASNRCFGACIPTPEGRAPHDFLDVIYEAIKVYRHDRHEDPTAVEEMVEIGYISWPEPVSTQWIFSFLGQQPITQIVGVSTAAHPAGAGHVIRYDVQTALHSGWGLEFDGTFQLDKSDTFTARIWFAPKLDTSYNATLTFTTSFREGVFTESQAISCVGKASLEVELDGRTLPTTDILLSAYPNPFNSTTTIIFSIPAPTWSRVLIFDEAGHEVAILHDGWSPAGKHYVRWDATGLPSGAYLPTLVINGQSKPLRAVFVR